jgi:hypothetical protein
MKSEEWIMECPTNEEEYLLWKVRTGKVVHSEEIEIRKAGEVPSDHRQKEKKETRKMHMLKAYPPGGK